jgi:hypothetical protein
VSNFHQKININDINSLFAEDMEEDLADTFEEEDLDNLDEISDDKIFKVLKKPCLICKQFGCHGECCELD